MYASDEHIQTPPDDTIIWRYMSVVQLLALITSASLRFTRLDQFADKWEGAIPDALFAALDKKGDADGRRQTAELLGPVRTLCAANCWHGSSMESDALWTSYGSRAEAVAVRTTVRRLRSALSASGSTPVFIGQVSYIDYASQPPVLPSSRYLALYKRRSFEHEREVRALVFAGPSRHAMRLVAAGGISVPVDVGTLIEQIWVAPSASDWQAEAVRATVSALGLAAEVRRSTLDQPPTYTRPAARSERAAPAEPDQRDRTE